MAGSSKNYAIDLKNSLFIQQWLGIVLGKVKGNKWRFICYRDGSITAPTAARRVWDTFIFTFKSKTKYGMRPYRRENHGLISRTSHL